MKTKKRTKPTNAEIGKVIGDITKTQGGLIEWVEYLKKRIDLVDNTLGAYLDMNKDGQNVEIEFEAKCEPIASKWTFETELKAGGFDLGPVKPWTTVSNYHADSLKSLLPNTNDYLIHF